MVFAIPDSITSARCPNTYLQLAAEKAHGILSPGLIEKYQNEIANAGLIVLAIARVNNLRISCDDEAQAIAASKVNNFFLSSVGKALDLAGETLLSLSAYLRGPSHLNYSSNGVRKGLLDK